MNNAADRPELARAQMWGLLGALLREPPQKALFMSLAELPDTQGELALPLRRLKQLALTTCQLPAFAEQLAVLDSEFHRLFIGVGRGELLPYGSFYQKGFLMDQPLSDLRMDLQQLGLQRRHHVNEPEDYVVALTEVMALLIQAGNADDASFFTRHVDSWLPRFFDDLITTTTQDFYRAIGELGLAICQFERRYFSLPIS